MSAKQAPRRGLGRGLGSLIPQGPAEGEMAEPETRPATPQPAREATSAAGDAPAQPQMVAGAYFAEIPVEQISPNHAQPREVFEEEAMAELVHSIKEVGLLQPVVVRRTGDATYELIMGERRWRASKLAERTTIPAIVRQTDDNDMLR
ncbi:MAG TPA: ParB/RepB/Spo0J family partition protein, partial [Marmoricola sp.]|nr:ParB/RepB/Spo0J family partition protein [Marmoricola sp.]